MIYSEMDFKDMDYVLTVVELAKYLDCWNISNVDFDEELRFVRSIIELVVFHRNRRKKIKIELELK